LTKGSQHSNHIVIIHGRLFTLMTKAVAGANPTGIFQLSRASAFGCCEVFLIGDHFS